MCVKKINPKNDKYSPSPNQVDQVNQVNQVNQVRSETAFVVKPMPGSRKMCLVGINGLKAIDLIDFITNDLLLIKMKGNYWTILDV